MTIEKLYEYKNKFIEEVENAKENLRKAEAMLQATEFFISQEIQSCENPQNEEIENI